MKAHTIDIITLGCSKNLVDSQRLTAQLEAVGYCVQHDPEQPSGEIAVINTCGFIASAKEESINVILSFCRAKEEGRLRRLYVMGCLSERYLQELQNEIPQVDKYFGKFNWPELLRELGETTQPDCSGRRTLITPSHYAYIKISEGCDRACAYCAIPLITGHHTSRPIDEVLDEVRALVQQGVKEFQIIAQELTYYGLDLYHEQKLPALIERMAQIEGVRWIRLHYAYPTRFPLDLLRVMRTYPNVCNYLDIALQHISDRMLDRMQRHISRQQTIELLRTLRTEVPGIHLRTTLMVGFPGETQADFDELKEFVRTARFERMGAFAYSEEEGTYAATHYADDVPDEVKQARLDEIMALQQTVSAEHAAAKIGRTLPVVIDRIEGDYYIGRTEYDSPDVDPEVLIPRALTPLHIGHFYHVRITDADDYDLYGESCGEADTYQPSTPDV